MLRKHTTCKTLQNQQTGQDSQFRKVKKHRGNVTRSSSNHATASVHVPSTPLGLLRHPKARERTRKTCQRPPARAALLTKHQSKRDAANVSPSPLLDFFVGAVLALALAARFSAPTWDPSFRWKAPHHIVRISLQSFWDPVDEHFKLTDVLESGRLSIRLRRGLHRSSA